MFLLFITRYAKLRMEIKEKFAVFQTEYILPVDIYPTFIYFVF